MTYVPMVHVVTPEAPPSRQTQELADLLGRVVQEYEKAHPTVTGPEVSQALQLAKRASTKAGGNPTAMVAALAGGLVLMVGLGVVFFAAQGGGIDIRPYGVMIAVVGLGVVAGFVALLKRMR